jgi:hypothetical protein
MTGWMAPLRHVGAKMLVGCTTSEQEARHMTASDFCAARQKISCHAGAIQT